MFEAQLEEKLKKIFKVKKVTYNTPGESQEQETLFVQIEDPKFNFSDKRVTARITGSAVMFGRNDALKFGFFAKSIEDAPAELTKDLFFNDFEKNTQRFLDIVQRGFSFVYFFNSQYDPDIGTITSVTTTVEET